MAKEPIPEGDYLTKAIGQDSINYIKKIGIKWLALSMLIFYTAYFFKIDSHICGLCVYLSNKIIFIERFANVSSFPNAMRMQWLFLVFSSPAFFYLLLININKIEHGGMSLRVPICGVLLLAGFIYGVILTPVRHQGGAGVYEDILRHHLIGSPIASFIIFSTLTVFTYSIYIYFEAYIKYLIDYKFNEK